MIQSTFIPLMTARLYPVASYDVTGKVVLKDPIEIGIAPIRLDTTVQPTSIRTDKSGSKSRADEVIFQGRVLVHPKHTVQQGQIMEISGTRYRIVSVWPRYEMNQMLHHWQVDLSAWQE